MDKFLSKKGRKRKKIFLKIKTEAEDLSRREQSTNNGIKSGRVEGGRYRAELLGIYA